MSARSEGAAQRAPRATSLTPYTTKEKSRRLRLMRERWNREARKSFLRYCQHPMWGDEIPQLHHEAICAAVSRVEKREIKRLMIFAPPGSAKSSYTTHRFASWYAGRHPGHSLICATHTAQLSHRFGKRVRNTVGSVEFREVFPGVGLAGDSQAKGDWAITHDGVDGGEYYAVGFDGAVAGRRCDGLLIDDPIKSIRDADSETVRDNVWDVYRTDLRSRLKGDTGWIIIIQTRWHVDDLSGRILPESWDGRSGWVTSRDGEEWYVLRLAMECDSDDDPLGRKLGETLWPEWWSKQYVALEKTIQGTRNWNALYQGLPTTEEGAILKASYWRQWPKDVDPPVCDYVIQSIDGAFEEDEEADYSARTTWGIFDAWNVDNAKVLEALGSRKGAVTLRYHAILLEAWRGKVPFHVFKRNVRDGYDEYEPDKLLIEKRASGHSLIQELRRGHVPVKEMKADRSKLARTHAAEPAFEAGCVWYVPREWAQAVIRECAQFPNGEHDDWHDTVTQAIGWVRRMFHLRLPDEPQAQDDDEPEELDPHDTTDLRKRATPIYG